jgi:hypothetical protein
MTDMMPFTVEAVTRPVHYDEYWLPLRRVTDLIPGSFLIEDPDEPTLVMPVNSSTPARAALFVEGVLKQLVGVEVVSTCVRPAEDDDGGQLVLSPEVERQHQWAENVQAYTG